MFLFLVGDCEDITPYSPQQVMDQVKKMKEQSVQSFFYSIFW